MNRAAHIIRHRERVRLAWRDSPLRQALTLFGPRARPEAHVEHQIVSARLHLAMHYICRAEGRDAHAQCHCTDSKHWGAP